MVLLDSISYFPKYKLKSEIWEAFTSKDRLTLAKFDFHSSLAFSKLLDSLNLPKTNCSPVDIIHEDIEVFDLDEELVHALDHHSHITSQLPDDHIQTADEIIEEIDRIMIGDGAPVLESEELDLILCDPQAAPEIRALYAPKSLMGMTLAELNALVDELDVCVRHYSSCLVRELAMRDELEYEQDVKDLFFTRLHEVQTRVSERITDYADQNVVHDDIEENENEKARGLFSGTSSAAAAKELLANAALAVLRRWRRMSQSFERARSTWHNHRSRRNRRITVDENLDRGDPYRHHSFLRGSIQPVSLEKLCVSNSNVELASSDGEVECGPARMADEEADEEWSVRSDTNSVATTPTTGSCVLASKNSSSLYHSPRRHQIWFTLAAAAANRGEGNSQEDLKFLKTRIPYHRSSPSSYGPTVGHLELFNEFLLCMLTNNPNLTSLLTDYILNVYAPSEKTVLPKLAI